MKISLHTKVGEKEETISFDFQSDSKTDCTIVEKYTAFFNESMTDGGCLVVRDDKEFAEKLRRSKTVIMAQ